MMSTRGIVFYILLLTSASLFAQGKPVIKASVDKNKVLLGEPFQLKVTLQLSQGAKGSLPDIDSIPHFEFENPQIDSSVSGGNKTLNATYQLTSFDSGHWVIPSFQAAKGVKTDTIGIDVVFSEFDPQQPYHDIKDIIEVKPQKKKQWWWYAAGGALLLVLLLIYFLRKKKPVAIPKTESSLNPFDEAVKQLNQLQRDKPANKEYHTRLTDIFRLYVFRKKGILSLQKTTDDLVLQLQQIGLSGDEFGKLSQALRLSDFVKFAKFNPAEEDNNMVYQVILNAIKQIELPVS